MSTSPAVADPTAASLKTVLTELTGRTQLWLAKCQAAVRGEPGAKDSLRDRGELDQALASSRRKMRTDRGPVFIDLAAGHAYRDLALSLADTTHPDQPANYQPLLAHAHQVHLHSSDRRDLTSLLSHTAHLLQTADETKRLRYQRLTATLADLAGHRDNPATTYTALTACHLADALPTPGNNPTHVRVLFDAKDRGAIGRLTLTRLHDGPPGLHPDPTVMAFFASRTHEFIDSATNAWQASFASLAGHAILWSVTLTDDAGGPQNDIDGGSLGGAFGVALHHLTGPEPNKRLHLPRSLRRSIYSSHTAVTATVTTPQPAGSTTTTTKQDHDDHDQDPIDTSSTLGTLDKVDGIDHKVQAATKHQLTTVVVHPDNKQQALAAALAAAPTNPLTIKTATTITEAIHHTQQTNPRFKSAVALALAFVLVIGGAIGLLASRESGTRRIATAADLMRAASSSTSDRRTEALSALASYELDPTAEALAAMQKVVSDNQVVLRGRQVSTSAVTSLASIGNNLICLDASGSITVLKADNLDSIADGISKDVFARSVGAGTSWNGEAFGAMVGQKLTVYQGGFGLPPQQVLSVPTDLSETADTFGPFVDNSNGRSSAIVLDDTLHGAEWSVSPDQKPQLYQFDLSTNPLFTKPQTTGLRIRAAVEGSLSSDTSATSEQSVEPGWTSTRSLLLGTTGQEVFQLNIEQEDNHPTKKRVTITHIADSKAPITSLLPYNKQLLIGTERGVQLWDPATQQTVEFPFGGVAGNVTGIFDLSPSTQDQRIAIATDSGVSFLRSTDGNQFRAESVGFQDREITAATKITMTQLAVGTSSGRVEILDPTNSRFGPSLDLGGSNVAKFSTSNHLLLTQQTTSPNYVRSINSKSAIPAQQTDTPTYSFTADDPYDYLVYSLPQGSTGEYPYVNDITSTNRTVIAAGASYDSGGMVWVWNTNGKGLRSLEFAPEDKSATPPARDSLEIVSAVSATDQRIVAFSPFRNEIRTWDLATLQQSKIIPVTDGATNVVFARDAPIAAYTIFAPHSQTVSLETVDLDSGEIRNLGTAPSYRIAISPNGKQLALTGPDTVELRQVDGGRNALTTIPLDDAASAAAFSPDSKKLAVATLHRKSIQIVNTANARPTGPAWISRENVSIYTLNWNPDSTQVVVNTGTETNGRNIPASVVVLNTDAIDWSTVLCSIAGGDLTDAEWDQLTDNKVAKPRLCR